VLDAKLAELTGRLTNAQMATGKIAAPEPELKTA
jgi:hypothetical protein